MDAEWAVIGPLMPKPASFGRSAIWTMREILNAIFYVLRGGIAWRLISKDLPPRSTSFGYFACWRDEDLFERINHYLLMADRERVEWEALPTAGSSTARPSRRSRAADRVATMPARRSRAASAKPWSVRTGVRSQTSGE